MKHVYLIVIGVMLLAACSKEKQLEKTITKKDGKWNITSVDWTLVKNDSVSQQVNIGTATNTGSFTFENDGSGSYDFTVYNTVFSGTFSWTNDKDSVYLTHIEQVVNGLNTTQHVVAYSAVEVSKNEIEMAGSDSENSTNIQTTSQLVLTGEFKLTR